MTGLGEHDLGSYISDSSMQGGTHSADSGPTNQGELMFCHSSFILEIHCILLMFYICFRWLFQELKY